MTGTIANAFVIPRSRATSVLPKYTGNSPAKQQQMPARMKNKPNRRVTPIGPYQ